MKARIQTLLVLALLAACQSSPEPGPAPLPSAPVMPDVAVSRAPWDEVHVEWKQRLDQAYVFIDQRGDYRKVRESIEELFRQAEAQGVQPAGPLFGLFYDDPGRVPLDELRARMCLPVSGAQTVRAPLQYDVLDSKPVVYCIAGGPYHEVPRSYPGVIKYLEEHGWVEAGPWRETYLNPEAARTGEELLTEVQVPWRVAE